MSRSAAQPPVTRGRGTSPIRRGLALLLMLGAATAARAQHEDLSLYSTADGGGALVATPNPSFENPVFESLCIGGFCLYSSTDPGVITPSQASGGLFPLAPGTPVSFELVAADASVSVKIGSVVLGAGGGTAALGTAPSLHVHPTYQVQRQAGPGQFGEFPLSLRFKATGYADSPVYQMTLSNEGAAPSPTPSPVPTASPTPQATSTPAPTVATPTPVPTGGPPPTAATPSPRPSPAPTQVPMPTPTGVVPASPTPRPLPTGSPASTPSPAPTSVGGSPTPRPTASATPRPTPTAPISQPSPTPSGAPFPTQPGSRERLTVAQGGPRGDQVVFFYDAREGFRSFLSVANEGAELLLVEVLLYGASLETAFPVVFELPAGGTRTVDVEAERARGLAPEPGVAFATAVRSDGQPVVSRALSGSLSVANLSTSSSWGAAGAARLAFYVNDDRASLPPLGRGIDGTRIRLQRIAPEVLHLPVYFDPASLDGSPTSGSQLVFVSFRDLSGAAYAATAETGAWALRASHQSGAPIPAESYATEGVDVVDLASVLGAEILGSGGRVELRADEPAAQNRLVYFVQALGPFATGYALPAVDGSLEPEVR